MAEGPSDPGDLAEWYTAEVTGEAGVGQLSHGLVRQGRGGGARAAHCTRNVPVEPAREQR